MERSIKIRPVCPSHQATGTRKTAITCFLLLMVTLSGSTAFAQTGLTGIFGGGPFYKNAAKTLPRSRTPASRKPLSGVSRSIARAT